MKEDPLKLNHAPGADIQMSERPSHEDLSPPRDFVESFMRGYGDRPGFFSDDHELRERQMGWDLVYEYSLIVHRAADPLHEFLTHDQDCMRRNFKCFLSPPGNFGWMESYGNIAVMVGGVDRRVWIPRCLPRWYNMGPIQQKIRHIGLSRNWRIVSASELREALKARYRGKYGMEIGEIMNALPVLYHNTRRDWDYYSLRDVIPLLPPERRCQRCGAQERTWKEGGFTVRHPLAILARPDSLRDCHLWEKFAGQTFCTSECYRNALDQLREEVKCLEKAKANLTAVRSLLRNLNNNNQPQHPGVFPSRRKASGRASISRT